MESGQNSNSFKLLCMSSFLASMKNSGENVLNLFPHYKSMRYFSGAKGQLKSQSHIQDFGPGRAMVRPDLSNRGASA